MSWKDEVHRVPSRNVDVLARLVGRRITGLTQYAEQSPEALLLSDAYAMRNTKPSQLFALADGPAILTLDDGTPVAFVGSEALASITLEFADEPELDAEWPHKIEATDARYSEPRFGQVIGRLVVGLRVLQRDVDRERNTGAQSVPSRLQDRPREAGLVRLP
jgi:hypothetical protein